MPNYTIVCTRTDTTLGMYLAPSPEDALRQYYTAAGSGLAYLGVCLAEAQAWLDAQPEEDENGRAVAATLYLSATKCAWATGDGHAHDTYGTPWTHALEVDLGKGVLDYARELGVDVRAEPLVP
jgi:hypothetical protein